MTDHNRQIKVEALFSQYRIESNADNTIFLSVATDALLTALRSASNYADKASSSGVDIILRYVRSMSWSICWKLEALRFGWQACEET